MKSHETTLDPITKSKIIIKLFRNVKNVPDLRKKIISGDLKCCIIKPSLIIDPFQVVVAANKALVAEKHGRLVTRSIFSEILYSLSISKNVSKSLPQFGIDDEVPDILVAVILKVDEEENDEIFRQIDGDEHNLDELVNLTDFKLIKTVYSISADEEKYNSNLLDVIVNKIVIKDF